MNVLNETQSLYRRYQTRSSKKEKENDEAHEIDRLILTGMKRCVSSVIKAEVIRSSNVAKTYGNLDSDQRNIAFFGLSSICGLSNNSDSKGS